MSSSHRRPPHCCLWRPLLAARRYCSTQRLGTGTAARRWSGLDPTLLVWENPEPGQRGPRGRACPTAGPGPKGPAGRRRRRLAEQEEVLLARGSLTSSWRASEPGPREPSATQTQRGQEKRVCRGNGGPIAAQHQKEQLGGSEGAGPCVTGDLLLGHQGQNRDTGGSVRVGGAITCTGDVIRGPRKMVQSWDQLAGSEEAGSDWF